MEKRYGKIKSVTVKVQRGLGAKPPEAKRYIGVQNSQKCTGIYCACRNNFHILKLEIHCNLLKARRRRKFLREH